LDYHLAQTFIDHAIKVRKVADSKSDTIELSEEVRYQLQKMRASTKTKSKGRMVNFLGKKDLGEIKRKRKKKFDPLDIDQVMSNLRETDKRANREESKEEETPMNVDNKNDRPRSYSDVQREIDNVTSEMYYSGSALNNP
jgi:hypothetical protein